MVYSAYLTFQILSKIKNVDIEAGAKLDNLDLQTWSYCLKGDIDKKIKDT